MFVTGKCLQSHGRFRQAGSAMIVLAALLSLGACASKEKLNASLATNSIAVSNSSVNDISSGEERLVASNTSSSRKLRAQIEKKTAVNEVPSGNFDADFVTRSDVAVATSKVKKDGFFKRLVRGSKKDNLPGSPLNLGNAPTSTPVEAIEVAAIEPETIDKKPSFFQRFMRAGHDSKSTHSTVATHSRTPLPDADGSEPVHTASISGGEKVGFFKRLMRGGNYQGTTDAQATHDTSGSNVPYFRGSRKLSFAEVVSHTLNTNPEVGIAHAQSLDAKIAVDIEKTAYHPQVDLTVTVGAENIYSDSSQTLVQDRGEVNLSVAQTVYDFGKTRNAVARRVELEESANLRKADAEEKIALDLVTAYLGYLRQSDLTASSARNVRAHKKMRELVKLNSDGGNGTVADVQRVETRLDSAMTNKLQNDDRLEDSIAAFRRLTQLDPKSVSRPARLSPVSLDNSQSVDAMIFGNPEFLSSAADQRSLEKQLKQQQATLYPEFFIQGDAAYKHNVSGETGDANEFKGLFGMRFKIYDGGKRRRMAEQINARIVEADARRQKVYRELVQDLEKNQQALKTSREKSGFLSDSVRAAKNVINLYEEQFKAGKRTPFEMLDAQRDLYRSEQDSINHRYDTSITKFKNLRIQGKLVDYLLNKGL